LQKVTIATLQNSSSKTAIPDLGVQLTTFMEYSGHETNLKLIVGLQFVSLLNWDFSNHIWSQTILGNHTLPSKRTQGPFQKTQLKSITRALKGTRTS
jgi:hypothetical protein